MRRKTIIIENVDVGLLERQRLALGEALARERSGDGLFFPNGDVEYLKGLANMLDEWSDGEQGGSNG